jgi:hypothetical protein
MTVKFFQRWIEKIEQTCSVEELKELACNWLSTRLPVPHELVVFERRHSGVVHAVYRIYGLLFLPVNRDQWFFCL